MQYTSIHIIYNPKSTGDSEIMAKKLQNKLRKTLTIRHIECRATHYAGHAEKLARDIANETKRPLIISSSGDGGYNEVINGVMESGNPKVVCAVLPAGNANDHSSALHNRPLAESIIAGHVRHLDLLEATITHDKEKKVRYAHSYIGLGLTPVVAVELNRHSLNALREIGIVLKTFFKHRPFKILVKGKSLKLDSLVFGNINRMAKILSIASSNQPADGRFEVVMFPASHKWRLVKSLTKAAVSTLENVPRSKSYTFTALKKMPMQLDGEVLSLSAGSKVTIVCKPHVLTTVV